MICPEETGGEFCSFVRSGRRIEIPKHKDMPNQEKLLVCSTCRSEKRKLGSEKLLLVFQSGEARDTDL